MSTHVDMSLSLSPVVKCVLVASPGFLKDQFFDWLVAEAVKLDDRLIIDNKSKFLLIHSTSGHKHALKGTRAISLCLWQSILSDSLCRLAAHLTRSLSCRAAL